MNANHDLVKLIQQTTREMADEYERIRMRTSEDPGTAGDSGEENWAELLRRWLPSALHVVTKGRLITSDGKTSPQIDVLILSPSYPKGLLNKKLYLATGVMAAFECKNTLRPEHIKKTMRTSAAIGEMVRGDHSSKHPIVYGLLAHSHGFPAKRKSPEQAISETVAQADLSIIQDPRDCLDLICIANLGTWTVLESFVGFRNKNEFATIYMGPLEREMRQLGDEGVGHNPDPIGRFVTALLQKLGKRDREIASIADYFQSVGLFGVGFGQTRYWEQLPGGFLEEMQKNQHLYDVYRFEPMKKP